MKMLFREEPSIYNVVEVAAMMASDNIPFGATACCPVTT